MITSLRPETINNQKLLQGIVRKAQGAERKANHTIDAVRKAPCAMRLPPWPPEAKLKV